MAATALTGIKVLDLTTYLAGPFGGTLLGDMGADVLKIEPLSGDMMRHYPSSLEGESRAYIGANRNKRSIAINLKEPEGLKLLERLLLDADVLMHNFRPSAAKRLNLDYERLAGLNTRLVYCSLSGFGTTGPMVNSPGFDQVLQSMTGVAAAQGADNDVPQVVWGSVVDYYAASLVALGVCGALFARERTGKSQLVETSLLRSALAMQSGRMVWAENESEHVSRDLRGGRLAGIHPTKDGFLYLQAQTPPFWRALCELTGLTHLTDDPRYDDMRKRKAHEDELVPLVRTALAERTALEWESLFGSRVPCTAVRRVEDMFDHPQVLAEGLIATHPHPTLGSYRAMTGPMRYQGGREDKPDRRAPLLGEHTDSVLAENGYLPEQIEMMRAGGVVA